MSETARTGAGSEGTGTTGRYSPNYTTLWGLLLCGWIVSYADRTLTGPVIAWMIENEAAFIGDAANPAALGGLVGSMFFLGYMLTQYPGGRLGDQYGHREMIIVSLLWAAVLTIVSGLVAGLIAFVAARVLTGLGEGVFYSNDRTLILTHSPAPKRTLGLGVVISGLSIGLTVGILLTPILINLGDSVGMGDEAWRMPFYVFAAATLVVVAVLHTFFRKNLGGPLHLGAPLLRLIIYSAPTFIIVLALFIIAEAFGLPEWQTAIGTAIIAAVYIAVIVHGVSRSGRGRTLLNRDIWFVYVGYIAILWNLWFFSFWSVQIVKEAAATGLVAAALTAAFNAVAGIIGFPVGGWLADRQVRKGQGRKPLVIACSVVYSVLVILFGLSIAGGRVPSLWLLGLILFTAGIFFNAVQPIVQGMTGDMVPADERGSAFGLLNLISEIGAVGSPVVSGIMRDATGDWAPAVYLAAGLMLAATVLFALAREHFPLHHEDPAPA